MKAYTGTRTNIGPNDIKVIVDGVEHTLYPIHSQKIYNHSPDGFNWGYLGSGPAQAALGILLDCCDSQTAQQYYQLFKYDFVSRWVDNFCIFIEDIKYWLRKVKLT